MNETCEQQVLRIGTRSCPSFHTLAVIPARLASTRLPRKVLRDIAGKPMLQWIVEAALAAPRWIAWSLQQTLMK